jgi:hypothetical protein
LLKVAQPISREWTRIAGPQFVRTGVRKERPREEDEHCAADETGFAADVVDGGPVDIGAAQGSGQVGIPDSLADLIHEG